MKTLIKNAKIVDGSGSDSFIGDVLIYDEVIEKVAEQIDKNADTIIDAKGKTLTPGFIDSHSHTDMNVMIKPKNELSLFQGVTTTISGQCGLAAAPLCDEYAFWGIAKDIEEFYGEAKLKFDNLADMKKCLKDKYGLESEFETTSKYFELAKDKYMSFNIIQLAGHNNIRAMVMGHDVQRPATDEEIQKMCKLLEKELEVGCVGMSVGLDYYPGMFCATNELVELAKVLKKYDAIYTTHVRIVQQGDDGYPFKGELIGILEAIDVARKSGVKLHISHMLPYNYHYDEDHPYTKAHDAKVIKKVINNAIAEGIDVSYDVMCGETGGQDNNYLVSTMKHWVKEVGSVEELHKKLFDDEFVAKVAMEVAQHKYVELSIMWEPSLDDWMLVSHCKDKRFEGKTIRVISRELGCDHMTAICQVLKADIEAGLYKRIGCIKPEFLLDICNHDRCFPSCDGISYNHLDVLGDNRLLDTEASWLAYNFAIRFIKEFSTAHLEKTIKRMTYDPCFKHGITDRGLIKEGYYADIVILDEEKLDVNQDITKEKASPKGIEMVFVNGALTVKDGVHTGAMVGRFAER